MTRKIMMTISYLSLLVLIAAPILLYSGRILLPACKNTMLIASIVWFASAPLWMGKTVEKAAD